MLQNLPIIGVLPTIIGGLLILTNVLILINKITVKSFILLFYLGILLIATILNSGNISLNIKDIIYFINFVLLSLVVTDKKFVLDLKNILLEKINYIKINIICGNIILLIALFSQNAYYYEWGENTLYFSGFTYMPHVVASLCMLLLMFILFYIYYGNKGKGKKSAYIYMILPVYCILKTGARAYIIPLIIILVLILIKELGNFRTLITIIVLSPIVVKIFLKTSMFQKFITLLDFDSSFSLIYKLTSGRSEMWNGLIYHYVNKYNFLEKILGTSFDEVYKINYMYTGMKVWAHNDIINVLITTGIVGVLIYLISFYNFYKISNYIRVKIIVKIGYIISFVFLALMNGVYVQISIVFCLTIYWIIFQDYRIGEMHIEKKIS